ncbi:hypothetical protein FD17_GL001237 [Lentilactobacillus sunkii DSM 19904]|uniref:GmrSD restriction endonucleases N-terminal domain-containing protein n=2 Tax=Lentilactobacillus sunkii TaxID=481719 RepID=A0A0R1KVI9_9LACO|nr:hypothetical protein FD17_GL001237 [Lentilactobacillus sunkii DSM 19904]
MGELFKDNNFTVPMYQRNYDWESDQIVDFWDDLVDLVEGNRNSHFFGQIVTFKNEDGRQEIIDGQQRLTTSPIFMAVIKDIATKMYQDNFAKDISLSDLDRGDKLRDIRNAVKKLIRGDHEGDQASLVVEQRSANNGELEDYFYALTHKASEALNETSKVAPIKKMRSTYTTIHKWIENDLKLKKTLGERIDRLDNIFNSFYDKFYIVMISAPSRIDAFTIFETLNSRGKDLEVSDIIKNHLMSLLNSDMDSANTQWQRIASAFNGDSHKISRFIRTYWAASHKVIQESKLYRAISQQITNSNDATVFLKDLDALVEIYTVLDSPVSPKSHYEFFKNKFITQHLDILNRMHVMLYYPIVMAMYYRGYHEDDILKAVNKILSVFVRHRTINNEGTNVLESGFSEVAQHIWNVDLNGIDDIINELNDKLLKSDDSIKANFSALSKEGGLKGPKKWTLVYLLSEIYSYLYDDFADNNLYTKVFDQDNYKLVHISSDDSLGDYKDYIGNWTILEKRLATSAEEDSSKLVDALNQSELKANNELFKSVEFGGWDPDQIRERQTDFAQNVVNQIW